VSLSFVGFYLVLREYCSNSALFCNVLQSRNSDKWHGTTTKKRYAFAFVQIYIIQLFTYNYVVNTAATGKLSAMSGVIIYLFIYLFTIHSLIHVLFGAQVTTAVVVVIRYLHSPTMSCFCLGLSVCWFVCLFGSRTARKFMKDFFVFLFVSFLKRLGLLWTRYNCLDFGRDLYIHFLIQDFFHFGWLTVRGGALSNRRMLSFNCNHKMAPLAYSSVLQVAWWWLLAVSYSACDADADSLSLLKTANVSQSAR